MLATRRLQMMPQSALTLDIDFTTGGAIVRHQHALVELQFLRASAHWHVCHSGALLQAEANNVGCYDLCGGLWFRGADENLIESNAGIEFDEGANNWTANVLGTPEWVETYNMYGAGALEVTLAAGANHLYTVDAHAALVLDTQYLIGFLIGIPGATEATDPTGFAVPVCGTAQNALTGNICSGDPDGSSGNVRHRWLRTDDGIAYFELWEKVAGAEDPGPGDYHPGMRFKTDAGGSLVYVCTPTMYEANDVSDGGLTHGGQHWRGCMVRGDGDPVTTARESMSIMCATPELILPVNADGPYSIMMELAFGLEEDEDFNSAEIASDIATFLGWAKNFTGQMYEQSSVAAYKAIVGNRVGEFPQGSRIPAAYVSKFFGLVGQAGETPRWFVGDSEPELFRGTPDDFNGVQGSGDNQFSDAVGQLGGRPVNADTVGANIVLGESLDGIVRRLKIWNSLQAAL